MEVGRSLRSVVLILRVMKKETKVVMLPTEKASHIHLVPVRDSIGMNYEEVNGKLTPLTSPKLLYTEEATEFGFPPQHLYFLSDKEIKESDFWFNLDDSSINYGELYSIANYAPSCKKIIATTDPNLFIQEKNQCDGCKRRLPVEGFMHVGDTITCHADRYRKQLPRPSNEFLKKYCEFGGISTVLVEYYFGNISESYFDGEVERLPSKLKILHDNTIVTTFI